MSFPFEEVTDIDTGEWCLESLPCQHDCILTFPNGNTIKKRMYGTEILRILRLLGRGNDKHFKAYASRLDAELNGGD